MTAVACSVFGTIILENSFPGEKDKGKDYVSLIFTIGNIVVIPLSLLVGYLSDKTKMWSQILIVNGLTIAFLLVFIANINTPNFL